MDGLKVFISSTYRDLEKYRERVIEQILHMKQIPTAMEFFGSRPAEAAVVCFKEIEECDVFVGIYGFYYGYTPEQDGPSITEQEFNYARDLGKRCLCYFADESLMPGLLEKSGGDPEIKQERLKIFKNRINKKLVRSVFHSVDDLSAKLGADLSLLLQGETLGLVVEDIIRRWQKWEIDIKLQVCAGEFNGGSMPFDYDSPLHWYWYKFAASQSWHEKLSAISSTVISYRGPFSSSPPFLSLTRQLKAMNWSDNYYHIVSTAKISVLPKIDDLLSYIGTHFKRNDIEGELYDLFEFQDKLQKLKAKIENPSYGKCFLVVGSAGAGKTHFITSIMGERNHNEKGQNYIILNLSFPYDNETLEGLILKEIQKVSGISWQNLETFDSFLKRPNEALNLLKEIFGEASEPSFNITKLVVVIDDLQEWLSRKPGFLKELTQFITSHTRLHSLYWLLTINYNCYHYLSRDDEEMFLTYSWLDTRESYEKTPAEIVHHIAGWFVLDEFNQVKGVGMQILRRELEVENQEVSLALDYISRDEVIFSKISSPFTAWTLLELKEELPLTEIVDLNYIEFVERLWAKRTAGFSKGEEALLKQCCIFIARYFADTWDFSPVLPRLKNKLAGYAEGISDLQDRDKLESTLVKLQEENFLSTFAAEENSIPVEKVQMRHETFWEWQLANCLLASGDMVRQPINQAQGELETWFARAEGDDYKEGIFEFMLLMVEQRVKKDELGMRFIEEFWDLGFHSPHLPGSAVWFAAPKAPVHVQLHLIAWINRSKYQAAAKRELFAYMYFLAEVSPQVIDLHSRLKLLQKSLGKIKQSGFVYYYFFIARKMIAAISDNHELVTLMFLLRGCEELGIADQLAAAVVHRLFHNIRPREDAEDTDIDNVYRTAFESIKEYLTLENKYAPHDYKKIKKERPQGKWKRFFFREWVLYEFTHYLVRMKGVEAFFLLKEWKWFRPEYFGFKHQVVLEMEREAAIAVGWGYRVGYGWAEPGKNPMKKILKSLLKSKQVRERKLAFHLIRHTVPVEGDAGVLINPALHPFLKKIYKDPEMKKLVQSFPKFFEAHQDEP